MILFFDICHKKPVTITTCCMIYCTNINKPYYCHLKSILFHWKNSIIMQVHYFQRQTFCSQEYFNTGTIMGKNLNFAAYFLVFRLCLMATTVWLYREWLCSISRCHVFFYTEKCTLNRYLEEVFSVPAAVVARRMKNWMGWCLGEIFG